MKKLFSVFLVVFVLMSVMAVSASAEEATTRRVEVYPSWDGFYEIVSKLPASRQVGDVSLSFDNWIIYFAKSGTDDDGNAHINVVMWDSSLHDVRAYPGSSAWGESGHVLKASGSSVSAFYGYYWTGSEWSYWSKETEKWSFYSGDDLYSKVKVLSSEGDVYFSAGVSPGYHSYLMSNDEAYRGEYLDRLVVFFNSKSLWDKVFSAIGVLAVAGIAIFCGIIGVSLVKSVIARFV